MAHDQIDTVRAAFLIQILRQSAEDPQKSEEEKVAIGASVILWEQSAELVNKIFTG